MSKREYEISIWKDELSTDKNNYSQLNISEYESYSNIELLNSNEKRIPILRGGSGFSQNYYMPFKEKKIAIIGTHTSNSETYAHSIKFKKNINGTSTLTFRLFINYIPEGETEERKNPFINLITNDTKIKLKYQNEWTDLIVKEIVEYSSSNEIEYKATDLYIEELSKNGLLLTYNNNDFNNTGTIYELGEKVLNGTNWLISKENSDLIRQKVEEVIYKAEVNNDFPVNAFQIFDNLSSGQPIHYSRPSHIYIFYSSLNNDEMRFQFLYNNNIDKSIYTYNSETGLITNTRQCYLDWTGDIRDSIVITTKQNGKTLSYTAAVNLPSFIESLELITDCRGERIVIPKQIYNDTVLGQPVNVYKYVGDDYNDNTTYKDYKNGIFYGFTSFEATTLDQKNLICNCRGVNKAFLKFTPEGWSGTREHLLKSYGGTRSLNKMLTINYNEITGIDINEDTGTFEVPAVRIAFSENEDRCEVENYGLLNENNLPDGFTPGEEYTFKVKYCLYVGRSGNEGGSYGIPTFLSPSYTYDNNYVNGAFKQIINGRNVPLRVGIEVYYLDNDNNKNIILTTEVPDGGLNYTPNRNLENNFTKGKNEKMIGEGKQNSLIQKGSYESGPISEDEVSEWYTQTLYVNKNIGSISKKKLIDLCREKKLHIKVFAMKNSANKFSDKTVSNKIQVRNSGGGLYKVKVLHVRLEDVQLFKTRRDMSGTVILTNFSQDNLKYGVKTLYNYYFSKSGAETKKEIPWLYREEARYLYSKMIPQYNKEILAIKSFEAKDSNRFNLIQKLCEKFECWAKFHVEHDVNGNIIYENGIPKKYITFHNYIGQENKLGFSYARNLSSIQRKIESNNITTKLIVKPGINEYGVNGTCDISRSVINPSRDIYFFDFSYYINKGFLNKQEVELDLYSPIATQIGSSPMPLSFYTKFEKYNKIAQQSSECLISLNNEYNRINEEYTIYFQNQNSSNFELEELFLEETPENWNAWYRAYYVQTGTFENFTTEKKARLVVDTYNNVDVWKKGNGIYGGKTQTYWYTMFNTIFIQINEQFKNYNTAKSKLPQIIALKNNYEKQMSYLNQNISLVRQYKTFLEKAFYNKYCSFIKEGIWTSNEYIDEDSYFLDAMTTLHNSSQPKVTYSIQVIDIGALEDYKMYDFYVGDRTYVQDPEFFGYEEDGITPYKESIIITEIEYDLDTNENTRLTVQNFKDQFESLFQRITAQTQSLQIYQGSYTRAATAIESTGIKYSSLQNALNDNSDLSISNPQMKNVKIGADGITSTNPRDTAQSYKIGNRGFELSYDSGASWMTLNEILRALEDCIKDK